MLQGVYFHVRLEIETWRSKGMDTPLNSLQFLPLALFLRLEGHYLRIFSMNVARLAISYSFIAFKLS